MISRIKELLSRKEVQQFIRFCIVGGICAIIDAAIFYVVRLFAPYQVALISGYLISLCVNYLLTVYWTFRTESSVLNLVGIVGAHMFNLFVAAISAVTNYIVIRTVVKYSQRK